ncbi:MAG: NrdH-redoxin [Candidatus Aenigmatarchaeota archaeon]|nr:MAG: NrdH-redoxin [Candidatus Aenigmarchaeota archaeon]
MPKVRVYTTPVCPWCERVKQFLREHGVEFEEVNVMEDRKAAIEMIEKSGQMGVPVIEIDGQIVVGYNPERLKELLKL